MKPASLLGVVGDTLITGEPVDKVFSGLSLRLKNRAGQPCTTRFLSGTTAYDNSMISGWRERTCRQHCQEVSSKKDSQQGKGTCKHRKNVHFCRLQGIPLTPMPPAGGRLPRRCRKKQCRSHAFRPALRRLPYYNPSYISRQGKNQAQGRERNSHNIGLSYTFERQFDSGIFRA